MDDKKLMETMLYAVKSTCDLYLHGAIESPTGNVHGAFSNALDEALEMQNQIYSKMSEKGWYTTTPAPQAQIDQTANKFCCQ
ncbi:MAG: spore coat protein [Ruminococcaceae bacterium]|nr:spore coat protein [Oscillospiraceae bacterium]MBQ3196255.1 spore coat protein [Clostridia bacterium]